MRSDIFLVITVLLLIAAAGCQGSGSSSGGAPESPLNITIVDLACSGYTLDDPNRATSSQFDDADKLKNTCKLVLTWWYADPSQTWCPYIMDNSNVEYCGPYDNWGYISSTNNKNLWDLGGDIYNDYILANHPEWVLKDADGDAVSNIWIPHEHLVDHGNMDFVDFYFDYFIQVPIFIAGGRWKGTYTQRSWNLRFLDNFIVYAPEVWSSIPTNPLTGKPMSRKEMEQDLLNATKRLRERADNEAGGLRYVANIWSDVESGYFERDIYPELMEYIDYALFETWTSNLEGVPESEAIWLRRLMAAQDMIENRRAEPVVQVAIGDFWYSLSSLLLVSEKNKGMIWSKKIYPDILLQQLSTLDLGDPLGIFVYIDNAYQRQWEKGKVIVNPSDSTKVTISLDRSYKDAESGEIPSTITLPPKTGKILLAR